LGFERKDPNIFPESKIEKTNLPKVLKWYDFKFKSWSLNYIFVFKEIKVDQHSVTSSGSAKKPKSRFSIIIKFESPSNHNQYWISQNHEVWINQDHIESFLLKKFCF